MILSTAYFPPVEYFALLAGYSSVFMDARERYQKQSYRNRCRILTANGPMDLRFPTVHNGEHSIARVQVDYSTPWVRQTEYAIETAYMSSPFFIYYRDELFGILDSRPRTLWDLNSAITDFFRRKIGLTTEIVLWNGEDPGEDYRELVHPKKMPVMETAPYWQVFRDKFGFVPNLSVMDLLFNEGPESICYLRK